MMYVRVLIRLNSIIDSIFTVSLLDRFTKSPTLISITLEGKMYLSLVHSDF